MARLCFPPPPLASSEHPALSLTCLTHVEWVDAAMNKWDQQRRREKRREIEGLARRELKENMA